MTGVDNPIETDDEAEGDWHSAEGVDKDELPGGLIGGDMAGNAPMDDAVDGDTSSKGNGEDAARQDKHF